MATDILHLTDEEFWNVTPKYIITKAQIYSKYRENSEQKKDDDQEGFIDEVEGFL